MTYNNAMDIEETENEAVAPGQLEDDELHQEKIANLRRARRARTDWREEKRNNDLFEAGHQWAEEDSQILLEQQRPAVVFNLTCKTYNAVSGTEIQNPRETSYYPQEITDSGFAGEENQIAKWVRQGCDAQDEESDAFREVVKNGEGWMEMMMSYEDDSEGQIKYSHLDSLEMLVDPRAWRRNYTDARYKARIKEFDKDEFKRKWPNEEFVTNNFWSGDLGGAMLSDFQEERYHNDDGQQLGKEKTTWVAQYQYWEIEPYYKVYSPEGGLIDMPGNRVKVVKKQLDKLGIKYVKYEKKIYKECFFNQKKILEERTIDCGHFTFFCMTGIRDKAKGCFFGLGRLMRDPQQWINKWLSQIQHIVNTGAKGGGFHEKGTFANPRKAMQDMAKPGSWIELNAGGIAKILERQSAPYPSNVDRMLQYAIQMINDVSGVNLELLGLADRDQAIGLEETRKTAGITMLAPIFQSLALYHKQSGRVLMYFIREYISDGRLARILGNDGMKQISLIKDKMASKYDIVVGEAPTSANMKERIAPILAQAVDMALRANIPIPPDIFDYSLLPDALGQKWKQYIVSKQQDPMTQQMQQLKMSMAQLELQHKQAEIQKMSSEMSKNYAAAEQAHATGLDQAALAQQRMDIGQAEQQIAYEEALKEQNRKDLESHTDMKLKTLQVAHDIAHQGLHTAHQIQHKGIETANTIRRKNAESEAKIAMQKQMIQANSKPTTTSNQ